MSKNQANAKQHTEAENYSNSFYTLSFKNNIFSKISKKQMCQHSWDYTVNHNKNEEQNEKRSHRYDINRPRSSHGYKYSNYKKCHSMIMLICIK